MSGDQLELRSELLMPAGSLEKLKTAILYGADAVYAGIPDLSLRTKSSFTLEELREGIQFAHDRGKKVYLTLNLFTHNKDIPKLPVFIDTIRDLKPDGLIIADPGVFQFVKEHAPELELHISTQANVCSTLTTKFWEQQGASLVVLAREVSFEELTEIRKDCPDIKLETFVHGAMCMTYSGRCLLSNFLAERGANQGNCAHSCRWGYTLHVRLKDGTIDELEITEENKELFEFLMEENFRPGEFIPIEEDMRGAYILNSKDLCLMPRLNEYLELGIDSLKIEGRNKTNYYAAVVARAYRRAIDAWKQNPKEWDPTPFMEELDTVQNRGYTLAFHEGRLSNLAHNYESGKSVAAYEFAGYITHWEGEDMIFEIKNALLPGDLVEFLSPVWESPIRVRFQEFVDAKTGTKTEKVSAGQGKAIRIPKSFFQGIPEDQVESVLPSLTVARKKKFLTEEEKARLLIELEERHAEVEKLPVDEEKKRKLREEVKAERARLEGVKIRTRGPRMGVEGCCGKGCNGCMIFWQDPKYAEKREELKKLGVGRKL
jgi:putative protease